MRQDAREVLDELKWRLRTATQNRDPDAIDDSFENFQILRRSLFHEDEQDEALAEWRDLVWELADELKSEKT